MSTSDGDKNSRRTVETYRGKDSFLQPFANRRRSETWRWWFRSFQGSFRTSSAFRIPSSFSIAPWRFRWECIPWSCHSCSACSPTRKIPRRMKWRQKLARPQGEGWQLLRRRISFCKVESIMFLIKQRLWPYQEDLLFCSETPTLLTWLNVENDESQRILIRSPKKGEHGQNLRKSDWLIHSRRKLASSFNTSASLPWQCYVLFRF